MICHICSSEADFCCEDCDQPVCENCCVPYTSHTPIEGTLCVHCHDTDHARRYDAACAEEEKEEERKAKFEKKNATRRALYWKPENVAKRRITKAKRAKERSEYLRNAFIKSLKLTNAMFNKQ